MTRRRPSGGLSATVLNAFRRGAPRRWLALWLMLVNVVGAPLAPGVVMAAAVPATLNGLPYVICAPGGPIAPGGTGVPGDQAPGHAADFCVFCLPLLHGAAAVAPPPPLPGPPSRVVVPATMPTTMAGLPARRGLAANGARAPPA